MVFVVSACDSRGTRTSCAGYGWKEHTMIHVTVSYPNDEGTTFDHDYYLTKHLPMVRSRLGSSVRGAQVDRALSGAEPGSQAEWMAAGHLYFESLESFQASFGPNAGEILGDIPNFTNAQPTIVISQATDA